MGSRGPRHLRKTTNVVLDALIKAAEASYRSSPLGMNALKDIVESLKRSPDFEDFYRRSYRELMDIVEAEKNEQRRTNAFGRLIVHPLGQLIDDGTIDRDLLPNIFSFIHLVLGDDSDRYGEECQEIVRQLKAELREDFTWDAFYGDPRAKLILWRTLVRIAASFKRWDLRKDWFMKLMQYTPTSVSTASNAFVVRERDHLDGPRVFGEHEFCAFFHALFAPLTEHFGRADEDLFRHEFGQDPHHHIGQFLVHLAACVV